MPQSDNDVEEKDNSEESQEHREVERKERTTPRQMWESQRQKGQTDEAARRLNVRPMKDTDGDAEDETAEEDVLDTSRQEERVAERKGTPGSDTEQSSAGGEEKEDSPEMRPAGETSPSATEHDSDGEEVQMDNTDEFSDVEAEPSEEPGAEQEAADPGSSADESSEARMVEEDQQPGMMRYRYATHGPAPEEERSMSQKVIPSSFVLGVLIIAGALLIGLALVFQHGRIVELEKRVNALENAISQEQDISTMNEE